MAWLPWAPSEMVLRCETPQGLVSVSRAFDEVTLSSDITEGSSVQAGDLSPPEAFWESHPEYFQASLWQPEWNLLGSLGCLWLLFPFLPLLVHLLHGVLNL